MVPDDRRTPVPDKSYVHTTIKNKKKEERWLILVAAMLLNVILNRALNNYYFLMVLYCMKKDYVIVLNKGKSLDCNE